MDGVDMNEKQLIDELLDIPEENQTMEFKRLAGEKVVKKIIQTIVAFTNTDGGRIIIGIDDPEKTTKKGIDRIYGIEENRELFDEVIREIHRISPPLSTVGKPVLIKCENGKEVAIIKVPKSTLAFRSIDNTVFVRLFKGNKRLTPDEIVKMSYAKGFNKADKELVEVDFNLLKTEYYDQWRIKRNINGTDIEDILFKTGLARKNKDGHLKPTRAAVLLFAEYPTNIMDTKCTIRVIQYAGTVENFRSTPNMVGLPKTIEGPIISLIKNTHEYVLTLLRSGIKIHSGFINKYKIPERAIKETITNAVIHRDYYIKRDIEIKIFEDRIHIVSPGLFPYNITASNIGYVRSEGYRNDLLVKHLREFPNPPNLDQNEGVQAIRNEMDASGLYPPIYISYPILDDSVSVVLLNEHRPDEWEKTRDYLLQNKYIANSKAREITGIKQIDKMSKLLSRWVKQGLLIKIEPETGGTKSIKYKLTNSNSIDE